MQLQDGIVYVYNGKAGVMGRMGSDILAPPHARFRGIEWVASPYLEMRRKRNRVDSRRNRRDLPFEREEHVFSDSGQLVGIVRSDEANLDDTPFLGGCIDREGGCDFTEDRLVVLIHVGE